MAMTSKVTVTLPVEQVQEIRQLVSSGRAGSVSGFVKHAVSIALEDEAGLSAMVMQALAETGGELTAAERAWADEILGGAA